MVAVLTTLLADDSALTGIVMVPSATLYPAAPLLAEYVQVIAGPGDGSLLDAVHVQPLLVNGEVPAKLKFDGTLSTTCTPTGKSPLYVGVST
ncbi:MAG: hypothetical protein QM803_15460 [Rhodocyclaceae bacterium]